MPRMPKYLKQEWAFFLDERGRKKYNELCRKCERSCKQSFRAAVIHCPHYLSKRRTRQAVSKYGKPVFRKSYSVLQDKLFEHMTEAGFTGFERGIL